MEELRRIFARGRWFFLRVSGRRRIGKTSLVNEARQAAGRERVLYVQVPDSDPSGVVHAAQDHMELFGVRAERPLSSLNDLARRIGSLAEEGWIVILDEFQYFNRKVLWELTSELQAEVDRLSAKADRVPGGLVILGSLHTEMAALLEDRSAPLYNRVTDSLELSHLDIASVLEILRAHADLAPWRLLFLWNLFEGVPKFYRDCFEQGVLGADRRTLLRRMFFSSSSPLRTEADSWFLKELHGRYDVILKYVAARPGCTNAELLDHVRSVDPSGEKQVASYLKALGDRYQMIERLQPIFARPTSRNGRFYIRDNFLRAWLAALAVPASSVSFQPLEDLVSQADERLACAEGHGLERLVSTLYEELSRKKLGDFSLTRQVRGWWDRSDTEIDLVAVDEGRGALRLGTCKRSPERLIGDLSTFDGHVERFLAALPRYRGWKVERVAIAPELDREHRTAIAGRGYLAQDLGDLISPLLS